MPGKDGEFWVVERQRNGLYRVTLTEDEMVEVRDVPTEALALAIDRALEQAYYRYRPRPPWLEDDN